MTQRQEEILSEIMKCSSIKSVLGTEFLIKAIEGYQTLDGVHWSPRNFFIANYFMYASYYPDQANFISEFDKMLAYFEANHPSYIKSKNVLSRLTAKDEHLFQGKWSELAFTFFLTRNKVDILDIAKMENKAKGEEELFDIKTRCGEIEVTTILSEKGRVFDTNEVFMGLPQLGDIEKQLVNKKIKKKSGNQILAIDATFVEELYVKLLEARQGLNIDFDVFRRTSMGVFLFIRNPATAQVGLCKAL